MDTNTDAAVASSAVTSEADLKAESAKTLKQFRSSQDFEDLYRFIHDNDVRKETHHILGYIIEKLSPPKKRGRRKSKKKVQ